MVQRYMRSLRRELEGADPRPSEGWKLMPSAASFGSRAAERFLGQLMRKAMASWWTLTNRVSIPALRRRGAISGAPVPHGKSLLEHSDHPDRDYVLAIAWLDLAANYSVDDSDKILQREDSLETAQVKSADQLKTKLVRTSAETGLGGQPASGT